MVNQSFMTFLNNRLHLNKYYQVKGGEFYCVAKSPNFKNAFYCTPSLFEQRHQPQAWVETIKWLYGIVHACTRDFSRARRHALVSANRSSARESRSHKLDWNWKPRMKSLWHPRYGPRLVFTGIEYGKDLSYKCNHAVRVTVIWIWHVALTLFSAMNYFSLTILTSWKPFRIIGNIRII